MNTFILSQKTIPDLNSFHKAVKVSVSEFVGFLIEDNIVTVELNVPVTQTLIDQIEAIVPPTIPIKDVTPRQIRQALVLSNVAIADIDAAINSLAEPTRSLARIEWEYSVAFHRDRPLVAQVGQMLGWTNQQLDDLWALAATL